VVNDDPTMAEVKHVYFAELAQAEPINLPPERSGRNPGPSITFATKVRKMKEARP
jgi:hypothetical protein